MSLNYDLSKIVDRERVCFTEGGLLSGETTALTFACIATGIGELNDHTIPEFWARLSIVESIVGPFLVGKGGPTRLTLEAVIAHKGLSTNVFPQETRTKWLRRTVGARLDDEVRAARSALKVSTVAAHV